MSLTPSLPSLPWATAAGTGSGPGAPPGAVGLGARLAPWLGAARWRRPGTLPVAIGCLALLAAAGLSLLLVPRWQADARAAGQALHQRATRARPVPAAPPPAPGPALRLQAALPAADQTPLRVAELLALAQRHDIAVTSSRQSPATRLDGGPAAAVSVSAAAATSPPPLAAVPLAWRAQGRYADLRAFVAAALQADAGLVLDQLRLSRADGRAALLDADLQWQLLQQGAAEPAPAATATMPPARAAR